MHGHSRTSRARRCAGTFALAAATGAALVAAGPLNAGPGAIPVGNLIQNPGFEDGPGGIDDNTVPPVGWQSAGKPSVWMYGVGGDRPAKDVATKIGGGANFLAGGQGGGAPGAISARASQSLDVSGAAVEIDAGVVAAKVSAFLGGYTAQEDTARVDAQFLGADGAPLASVRVGPVTREQRSRQTTLLMRSAQAPVPKGTRSVAVVVTMSSADSQTKIHGFADNISLQLVKVATTPPPPPALGKATLVVACSAKTLRATLRAAKGTAVRSVTFLVNGKTFGTDKTAPFTAHVGTRGLASQLKVTARVQSTPKTTALTKSIRRC